MVDHPPQCENPGRWQAFAEVALILAVFFIHAGQPVPDNNEPHYLCKAQHYWDAVWCDEDFFLESADAHLVFYWTFGWITQVVSLPAAAWIGRLLTWGLLAWAWRRLSWRVVPKPLIAVLTAALFVTLSYRCELAGEWVVGGVEAKGFAYILVLVGLERALAGRWNWAWLCLGGAAAFHVLVGGWAVVALGIVWLSAGQDRQRWKQMLPGLLGGGLLSLAGLIPALALTSGQPADITRQANAIYVFERLPHHLALLHLPPREIAERFLRHGCLLVALGFLWWWHDRKNTLLKKGDKHLHTSTAFAVLPPDRKPVPLLQRDVRVCRLLVVFAVAAFGIATCGAAIEVATWQSPDAAARLLRYYWFRLTDFAAPMAVALLTGAVIADSLRGKRAMRLVWLVAAFCLIGWHLGDVMLIRRQTPIPRCDIQLAYRRDSDRMWNAYVDWLNVCNWIRENTPTDAVFLTPRRSQSFKWRASRAEVVTRKDIPQDAAGIVEWSRRIRTIHACVGEDGEPATYRSLAAAGASHIVKLQDEFQFDYVLTKTRPVLRFPVVYRNDSYAVYCVSEHSK